MSFNKFVNSVESEYSESIKSDDSSFSSSMSSSSCKWTAQQDEQLKHLVSLYGLKQWKKVSAKISEKTPSQCSSRYAKLSSFEAVKGSWTQEEDQKLINWVQREGAGKWSQAAIEIAGRSGKQIRERWFNHLCPEVKTGAWTDAEDQILFDMQKELGTSWSKLAKYLPGRAENTIKNRFYSTLRKIESDNKKIKSAKGSKKAQLIKDVEEKNTLLYKLLSGNNQNIKVETSTPVEEVAQVSNIEDEFMAFLETVDHSKLYSDFAKLSSSAPVEQEEEDNSTEVQSTQGSFNQQYNSSEESIDCFFADFSSQNDSESQQCDLSNGLEIDFAPVKQASWIEFGESHIDNLECQFFSNDENRFAF